MPFIVLGVVGALQTMCRILMTLLISKNCSAILESLPLVDYSEEYAQCLALPGFVLVAVSNSGKGMGR